MPNYKGAFVCLLLINFYNITDGKLNMKEQTKTKSFVDYIEKYDPKNVWERLDKQQKLKGNLSDTEYIDAMFDGMDVTDELLKIKVQNGDARIAIHDSGRRTNPWAPPKGIDIYHKDVFNLRPRLYELMKQAIYQARNKLIIMQNFRAKYRNSSLYKMGYLMSKTDNACKTFSKFSFRAYKLCHLARQNAANRVHLYDILICEERLINLWFTVDLLVDVLNKNDHNCKEIIKQHEEGRLHLWKFVD